MKLFHLIVMLMLMLVMAHAAEAKMYKWVDENGKVHYSDKVPPDQVEHARERIGETGVVEEKIKRALTDEEKIAMAAQLKQEQEAALQAKLDAEKEAKERNKILMSYSSAEQIKRLKGERISALERNIQTAKDNLVIQEKNHADLMKRAADKERSGELVSETFLNQIQQVKEQIDYQKQFIVDKTNEIAVTETKYDDELKKYNKYTADTDEAESN
ncbi:DUF4124 domain-containing protein [Marinicella sp. S1101]|uniref:DUF4124 domain-containing protein n=1 Tax=Marinicella marina TaxID=2996016 RepID=UPI002260CC5A|nr:DUF4124 domain-containing protein [Marinicella marina]MCX7554149.1 DUF4124 domain-containing protein [Marinicella marina]MDJ1141158.1 DUF4124 domain-containing protein [Marinicella marina]